MEINRYVDLYESLLQAASYMIVLYNNYNTVIDGGSTKEETTTKVGPKDSTQKIAGTQVPSLDPKGEPKQTKISYQLIICILHFLCSLP